MMSRKVAKAWLEGLAAPEYRFQVLSSTLNLGKIQSVLKLHRDGKSRIAGLDPMPDLGTRSDVNGGLSFWSRDRVALVKLKNWLEAKGLETTGVW